MNLDIFFRRLVQENCVCQCKSLSVVLHKYRNGRHWTCGIALVHMSQVQLNLSISPRYMCARSLTLMETLGEELPNSKKSCNFPFDSFFVFFFVEIERDFMWNWLYPQQQLLYLFTEHLVLLKTVKKFTNH